MIRNLVFEGGGVKGIAYTGALQALDKVNPLKDVKAYAGTSAGAIMATLLACGCDSGRLQRVIAGTDFLQFQDDSFGIIRDLWRVWRNYGWNRGAVFVKWLQEQIQALTDNPEITFSGLKTKMGKDLYIIGTNLSDQKSEVYCQLNTPDMPIWEAARISMSIPLFFEPWRRAKSILADGGMTWNYPIDLFDGELSETIGFRVDSDREIAAGKNGWLPMAADINGLKDYCMATIGLMLDAANRSHLKERHVKRTIFIDGCGVSATNFSLSEEQKRRLIQSGYNAAKTWLMNEGH